MYPRIWMLLLDGRPFVNQQPLRHVLMTMTQPHGPKVLQVTGAPTSGKTYGQFLTSHVGRRVNVEVYLAPTLGATTTAREVVEDLALSMGLGPLPTAADGPQGSAADADGAVAGGLGALPHARLVADFRRL